MWILHRSLGATKVLAASAAAFAVGAFEHLDLFVSCFGFLPLRADFMYLVTSHHTPKARAKSLLKMRIIAKFQGSVSWALQHGARSPLPSHLCRVFAKTHSSKSGQKEHRPNVPHDPLEAEATTS